MTSSLLPYIEHCANTGKKLLAILIDPDRTPPDTIPDLCKRLADVRADMVFVGGSEVEDGLTDAVVDALRDRVEIPIVLFPGDHSQITDKADAVLFLSLLSGRNPEYLIEQQVRSVQTLRRTDLEIIPTGYILIDGGSTSSVMRVSKTHPISQENSPLAVDTAVAGIYKGKKLIYLEAGSGAREPVRPDLIRQVKEAINVPLIVGGGIRNSEQLESAYAHGADLIVIGTAFENNTFAP
jgi:putative glycerol-1-phosphate prenyltransferase